MPTKEICFEIRLTFVDDQKNGFTKIGAAAWLSKAEQEKHWSTIPALTAGDDSSFIAELIDADQWTINEEKRVSAETCEALMGKSIQHLIEEGRKDTCYTVGDMFAKHPELREAYPARHGGTMHNDRGSRRCLENL